MRQINVGIIGLGTVGSGVVRILQAHHDDFIKHDGLDIRLVDVAAMEDDNAKELGIMDIFSYDGNDVISNPDVDIVVELIGGTGIAKKFLLAALNAGKHVVTANKAIMASCGKEVLDTAKKNGVSVYYGASVGGGIPIIGPLKHSLGANSISSVKGIVNGTTNYMLTKMGEEGLDYETALKQAQDLGYAEANPSGDVEGLDAANKIAILASIAFNSRVTIDDVYVEGITKLSPVDLKIANEMGYAIKLLAIANRTESGIDVRVHPTMIPLEHQLAGVNGVFNAIYVIGDFVGDAMFFGEGAGSGPAASAVFGDIIEIAKMIEDGFHETRWCTCTEEIAILPIDELMTNYYLRIPVQDKPGVFAKLAIAFSDNEISLESVRQAQSTDGIADVIIVTHKAKESAIRSSLNAIAQSSILSGEPVLIRLSN